MPIYEYICKECNTKFDALRSMSDSDAPIKCKSCESDRTSRMISLFAAHSESGVVAGGGSACPSCVTHNCSTCGVS